MAVGSNGMTVEVARRCAKGRKKLRALVHMYMTEYDADIVAWLLDSFGQHSRALVD